MDETGAVLAVLGAAAVALGVWGLGTVRGRSGLYLHAFRSPAAEQAAPATYDAAGGLPRRAVLQLAWIEGRRTGLHPAFLSISAFWLLATLPFFFSSNDAGWALGGLAIMAGLGGLIAANLGALRSRRERTEELFGSVPLTTPSRTAAFVIAAWVPAVGAGLVLFLLSLRPGLEFGKGIPASASVDLWQLPVWIALACVFGVALARWFPSVLVAPVVVVVLFSLVGQTQNASEAVRRLLPLNFADPRFGSIRPAAVGWHIGYVAGLALVLGALAVLRSGGRWRAALVLGVGAALAVGAGILQTVAA